MIYVRARPKKPSDIPEGLKIGQFIFSLFDSFLLGCIVHCPPWAHKCDEVGKVLYMLHIIHSRGRVEIFVGETVVLEYQNVSLPICMSA